MSPSLEVDVVFKALTENGIDFLLTSAGDLESRPKYSVVHFAVGVELLLKARLLVEHWSLVLARPEKADLSEFARGEIQTIAIPEALIRLPKVTGSVLSITERDALNQVARHRNRTVQSEARLST